MSFKKRGVAPIAGVYCSCGGELKDGKCVKCGKEPVKKEESKDEEKKEE
jgi:hypothetical protein